MLRLPGLQAATGGRGIDWAAIHEGIGTALPSDYRELSTRCPSFSVDEFVLVSTPVPGSEPTFVADVRSDRETMEDDLREGDIPAEYATGTGDADGTGDEGGTGARPALLAWAGTPDGDEILWHTAAADPDAWPVVVRGRRGGWWTYPEGAVSFLEGLYSGRIAVPGLPASLPSGDRRVSFHAF
ncbi:hypothetical protein ACFWP2_10510 [Kitasatospora sp. NPDC058444]|uniref:hypothetical protein n=1 Tax=Kitasatospora sp. NPDC058444 TaxID=3346504 RepID=UPI00364E281A